MPQGTRKKEKNEILFSEFGVNYNDLPEQFKKGSVLFWKAGALEVTHLDLIQDAFWEMHPWILE